MKFGNILGIEVPKLIGYPIIAGCIGGLFGIGYYWGITKRNNCVELSFFDNERSSFEDSYRTNDICSLDLGVYGYDIDGISKLELKVDNNIIVRKTDFENVTEYTYILNLCNSLLNEGNHKIEVEITDNNGNTESDDATLTIGGRIEWI